VTPKKPTAVSGLQRGIGSRTPAERAPFSEDLKEFSAAMRAQAAPARVPRPEKPVRFTLDLSEDAHAALKRFTEESGAGVRASQVMRALLDELAEDPGLSARVRSRIRDAKRPA
jgi:uncharacterized protein (UPF0147 family)